MAIYNPPTEDLPIFDSAVFSTGSSGLTEAEGDARYLRFPLSQGSETISGDLDVVGLSTLDGATFGEGISPAYEIKYPVNSGRIDFYSNTAGGVETRGGKIDATGVHTASVFDTIDELAGTLNVGTATARTGAINIGTGNGGTGKTITIGTQTSNHTTTINGGNINISGGGGNTTTISNTGVLSIQNGSAQAMNIGSNKTGGTIDIGQSGATTSSTTISIGNGNGQTGTINIGVGTGGKIINIGNTAAGNTTTIFGTNTSCSPAVNGNLTLGNNMTAGSITLGGTTGGTTTLAICNGASQSGAINIGTGNNTASPFKIALGHQAGVGPDVGIGLWTYNGSNGQFTYGGAGQLGATGNLNLISGATSALTMGTSMTGGSITIGGTTGGTTTLDIGTGTSQTGAIKIGSGNITSSLPITIGNQTGAFGSVEIGTTTITIGKSNCATNNIQTSTGGTLNLKTTASSGGAINMGTGMTSGSITIGGTGTTTNAPIYIVPAGGTYLNSGANNQSIEIGGNQTSGTISIGTGASRTGAITLGTGGVTTTTTINGITMNLGDSGTTGGITIGVPLRPNYQPSVANADTMVGYKADIAVGTLVANMPTATANINNNSFSINNGVWLVNVVLRVSYATQPSAPSYIRLSLSTVSGTQQDARTIDFNPNASGGNFCNYTTTIANNGATNYWIVGASAGTVTPTVTSLVVNVTRIA